MISYYISFSALPHLDISSLDLSRLLQRAIIHSFYVAVVVQSLSHIWLFVTPQTAAHQAPLYPLSPRVYSNSCPLSWWCYLTIIRCCPLLFLSSIFLSIKLFTMSRHFESGGQSIWSFSFSISTSNEYSVLISFRTDWFDLAVQGTLKSLIQHHNSKASILWHSAFFRVQHSHHYWKTTHVPQCLSQHCL